MKKFKLVKEKGYFQSLRETKSVKELDDGAVEISGYASTKDKDRGGDIVEPKAFQSALERYMTNPIVLLQHKTDKPIGIVEKADIDDNGLYIKAKISQNTDGVIDLIKNGVLRAFSIGYSVKDYETDVKELDDGSYDMTYIIKDLELYEISVVSIPMNPYALSKSIEDMFEVEEVKEAETVEEEVVEEATEETTEEAENSDVADTDVGNIEEAVEEKSVEDGNENSETTEESEEGTNIQSEEETVESETEATEESEKIDTEYQAEETADGMAVEVKDEEVEKSNVVDLGAEENEAEMHIESETTEKADENSEISDEEEVEEVSENDSETESNDEVVDETSNNEVVETKSIESDSQHKQFDFDSKFNELSKSFDEKLAEKDEKIKSLESKVETMTKLFAESVETIDRMATAVKNTPVASGLQYKRPLKKGGYFDVASIIKSL